MKQKLDFEEVSEKAKGVKESVCNIANAPNIKEQTSFRSICCYKQKNCSL